jgi:protein involved in polysaccharide export with SLBB domain
VGLLQQIGQAQAVGRLVVNLPALLQAPVGSASDISVRDGDLLVVPRQPYEVTVIGQVQNATSHTYDANSQLDDYIALSGGMTRNADRRKTYVIRADGTVQQPGGRWFARDGGMDLGPGDTIVVPINLDRTPALPLWQNITQILYNLTVSLAAVKTF